MFVFLGACRAGVRYPERRKRRKGEGVVGSGVAYAIRAPTPLR